MTSQNPGALCKLRQLSTCPRSRIAAERRRTTYSIISDSRAIEICQLIGLRGAIRVSLFRTVITESFGSIIILLDANDISNIIILVNKGFVKRWVVSKAVQLSQYKRVPPKRHPKSRDISKLIQISHCFLLFLVFFS